MSAGGRAPPQRLFFASWPDEVTRAALLAAAGPQLPQVGRTLPAGNLHLTLVFLGNVPAAGLASLLRVGAALVWPATEVRLDRLDCWPRARVLVAVTSTPPPALLELEAELRNRLAAAGLRLAAQPFRPHVTLARDVPARPAAALAPPVAWPLAELALVASQASPGGSCYRPLARWPRVA